jgi:hypothetical protein
MIRNIVLILLFSMSLFSKDFVEIQNFSKRNYVKYALKINAENILNNVVHIDPATVKGSFKQKFTKLGRKDNYYIFTLDRKKAKIGCTIDIYKRNGSLLYSSSRIQGSEKKLNLFISEIFKDISRKLNINTHISIIPDINDSYIFRKFIFAKYLLENDKKDQAIDTLEDILISDDRNSEIRDLFISLGGDLSNVDIFRNGGSNSIFDYYILKGYKAKIKDIKITPLEHDSSLVDINIAYELRLKSGFKRKLLSTIKENKGNMKL